MNSVLHQLALITKIRGLVSVNDLDVSELIFQTEIINICSQILSMLIQA
jgi:hypothetical protein